MTSEKVGNRPPSPLFFSVSFLPEHQIRGVAIKIMKIAYFMLALLTLLAIAGGGYYTLQEYKRSVDNEAIHQCAQDYHQTIVNEGQPTRMRPMEQQVRECAQQKGVQDYNGVWSDLL